MRGSLRPAPLLFWVLRCFRLSGFSAAACSVSRSAKLSRVLGSDSFVIALFATLTNIWNAQGSRTLMMSPACSIPASTAHPSVARWCGAKPRLVLLNRVDMVSQRDRDAWAAHFAAAGQPVLWTDGSSGLGIGQARTEDAMACTLYAMLIPPYFLLFGGR